MPLVIFHVINDARSPYYCQVINILDTTTVCGVGSVLSHEKSTRGKFSASNCTLVCSFVDYTEETGCSKCILVKTNRGNVLWLSCCRFQGEMLSMGTKRTLCFALQFFNFFRITLYKVLSS